MEHNTSANGSRLSRFVTAQEGIFDTALDELRSGRKQTHWIWFIFPQIAGLGTSPTAQYYALSGLDEAKEYLAHPLLGPRLMECTRTVLVHNGLTAHDIFGSPDDLKFRSCMTLFELAATPGSLFSLALEKFFSGKRDERTLEMSGRK